MITHVLRSLPIGIRQTGRRRECDERGSTDVPADRYWGACTQRALKSIPADSVPGAADRLPDHFYRCYGTVKKAAATANAAAGLLPPWKRRAIGAAADDVIAGRLAAHFPLAVLQSGSGGATDANVNEVLANRSIQLLGGVVGSRTPIHPIRDVRLAHSVATAFTTAMHIAIVSDIEQLLLPAFAALTDGIERHGGPGSPSGYAYRLRQALRRLDEAEGDLHEIVVGEPAEADTPEPSPKHLENFAQAIAAMTGKPFIVAANTTVEAYSLDPVIAALAAVRGVAMTLLGLTDAVGRQVAGASDASLDVRVALDATATCCLQVIAEDTLVVAGGGPQMRPPLLVRSVLSAIRTLEDACATAHRIFTWPTRFHA